MTKPATQDDVARAASVTPLTVRRALKGGPGVGEGTRERIRKIAAELDYRPNAAARAMRRGRFGAVGLLLSTDRGRSYLPSDLVDGIDDALAEREIQLTVVRLPDEKLTDQGFVPRILREWCCDGLLINYTDHIPDKMIDLIERSRHPAVWLNTRGEHNCVYPDDFAGSRMATRRLLQLGHRRIAYAHYTTRNPEVEMAVLHYSVRDRIEGYREAMREAGLTPRVFGWAAPPRPQRPALARQWLYGPDRPTGVVAHSPESAVVVLLAAAAAGLPVPQRLSLVMIADAGRNVGGHDAATARVPMRAVGAEAVELLIERLPAPLTDRPAKAVAYDWDDGATLAPPAEA